MATPATLPSRDRSLNQERPGASALLVRLACLWHLTSVDAPTVAVVWCLAFAWVAGVVLPKWIVVVLALAAWAFYIADRLLDVRKVRHGTASFGNWRVSRGRSAPIGLGLHSDLHSHSDLVSGLGSDLVSGLRPRHHFHWRYRRIFVPLAIAASVVALGLVGRYMPWAAEARDSVLAAGALAYFASVHSPWQLARRRFRLPKELLVGVLFTAACAAPTVVRVAADGVRLLPLLVCFIGLAWLNCHAIEVWESSSVARGFSVLQGALCLGVLAFVAALGSALLGKPRLAALFAAAALSAALLALLDRWQRRMSPTTLRAAADLALLTPLALLVLG